MSRSPNSCSTFLEELFFPTQRFLPHARADRGCRRRAWHGEGLRGAEGRARCTARERVCGTVAAACPPGFHLPWELLLLLQDPWFGARSHSFGL